MSVNSALRILSYLSLSGWAVLALASDPLGNESWLLPPPQIMRGEQELVIRIPPSDIFEVAYSRFDVVLDMGLSKQAFVEISPTRADFLVGRGYEPQNGKKPYLIRAVFQNGATGGFIVQRVGDALLVAHNSLGSGKYMRNIPLVINLDFRPTAVFTWVGGGM